MESQPQNPEFRNNPENFQPCTQHFVQIESKRFDHTLSEWPGPEVIQLFHAQLN